ncbi:GDP-mannose 4,6-dehydratase [Gillisia limnaea]|uniref:NAD-dependent epimerase/dehydratase n=2 Tax=Gillisia TaxID=244698 RepID=H2BV90_GILLR|nr:GDP-mannose 4,6-dehydratase [Gillisia limnaea]EHQ01755.1 NAD-dependent epimerase/dehydratase [Gillisia limnaea DSM 15749]
MQVILITGGFGFVGRRLIEKLKQDKSFQIFAISRRPLDKNVEENIGINVIFGDLKNSSFVLKTVAEIKPNYIIHLAAESSVAYSWKEPNLSFQNNVNIYLNILESVRKLGFKSRILSIGSSEEYGVVGGKQIPIKETVRPNPVSPYAVARQAQSELSKVYVKGFGLDIVSTRSFNHFGNTQTDRFVIPSFINKVLIQKYNEYDIKIEVGDLSIIRDFLHVDDVVKAYIILLRKGITGELYNVCSGKGYSLKEILVHIYKIAGINENYIISEKLIRPNDNPVIIGSYEKLQTLTGWKPIKNLKDELQLMVNQKELYLQ